MKKIIVTGGAGYVGSILLRRLLATDHQVVCVDHLRFGGASLIDIWDHPQFSLERMDLNDADALSKVIKKHSDAFGIVHLAAIVGDPACKLEPELARNTNYNASVQLVEEARKAGIERFIFASTCSNYGKMSEPGGFVNEDSELAPVSLYAELKVAFEDHILNQIEKSDDFCPTSLRFATVYGMSPRMRFDLTVNEFTKELALERELVIFGEQFWRPYCYVGDFSRAIMNVLQQPMANVAYDVFNVGNTGENYTKKMIADALVELLPAARISYVEKNEDPRDYRVNFDKISDRLDFKISKTVPEGMKDVLECVQQGVVEDPDEQRFYNIPVR